MSDSEPEPEEKPNPDEITRKLADFIQSNFGSSVTFGTFPGVAPGVSDVSEAEPDDGDAEDTSPPARDILDFNYRPRDIKAHLDRCVIRQDEAKKVLSIAVCDHYNHARFLRQLELDDPHKASEIEVAKQNVIVVGPTGVGKTYLIKHIADLIGVPFVKADATKFSETGYVGGDVDDLVRDLVHKAEGDVSLAEYGIIYIDEIDKLATSGNMIGRDVSGRGVQTTLLKLMEETEVSLRNPMDIQSQMQAMFDMQRGGGKSRQDTINTRHILFIVSGAFTGLEELVRKRLSAGAIGFGADVQNLPMDTRLFREVNTQDFIDYGFEAEFIGRLPVRVVCEDLAANDLYEIMKNSEGSLIRQFEREFEAFGIRVHFEDRALTKIAASAEKEKTGARGLMTVCEKILRGFKFELPGTGVAELKIDEALVDDPESALQPYLEIAKKVTTRQTVQEVDVFRQEFRDRYGIELAFEEEAVREVEVLSRDRKVSPIQLCKSLFRDYQFGLKLIRQNTGRREFNLTRSAIIDPDKFLSDLVVKSYRDSEARPAEPGSNPKVAEGEDPA